MAKKGSIAGGLFSVLFLGGKALSMVAKTAARDLRGEGGEGTELVYIEGGKDLIFPAERLSSEDLQQKLADLYWTQRGKNFWVCVTPQNQYQIEQGWPEEPFVNVNTIGSVETTKENWLGYIKQWPDNEKKMFVVPRLEKIIEKGKCPVLRAKVVEDEENKGCYKLIFFLSKEDLVKKSQEV